MAADIVRGVWSAEEDAKLTSAVAKYGTKYASTDVIHLSKVNCLVGGPWSRLWFIVGTAIVSGHPYL